MRIVKKAFLEKESIRTLLKLADWNQRQIEGQIEAIDTFLNNKNSLVLFAIEDDEIVGYISAQFYPWNCLGQIHGLVIHPHHRKKGFGSHLVKNAETFMKEHHARGIYVDTPVNNFSGCIFYKNNGYKQAYIMPEYYDKGLDGVTFLKLWR